MKRERPDVTFARPSSVDRTLHEYPPPPPRPPARTFDPISSTLRLPFAPPRPTDPPVALLSAPSIPALECDANAAEETVVTRRRVNRGPWMLLGAIGAATIIGCFALVGQRAARPSVAAGAGVAAPLKAPQTPPCDSTKPVASGKAPCPPSR